MRSFDNWNKYTDNDNHPLHGCIHFVVNDGNTSAPIYDKDGTPLDNPQLTDIYGRTQHQVFINEDVIAYYYKYIGNGEWYTEMNIDPSDTSKWQLQYTSKSEMFIDIENDSKSSYAVLNIEDLRDLSPTSVPSIDGVKVITLMGYNEAGDKEPINYIWDAESTDPDDGGAVIATDLIKGRWIMVCPTEHLDVRHYGVFPSNSQNMVDQTLDIQYALVYANNHGLRLFFDTLLNTQYYHYYKLTNITLNPINQIDVAKGVEFIDDDVIIHSQQTNAFRNDPYFLNGDTTLYSNYAKASWNIKALNKAKSYEPATYIIDATNRSTSVKTLQGWNVSVNQNITGYTFVQCNISGDSLISSCTLTSCNLDVIGCLSTDNTLQNLVLTEKMFNGSPTPQTAVNGCIADIDNFATKVNLWNYLHQRMGDFKDIDFKNVTIPSDFAIMNQELGDRTYSNFIGTGTSHTFGESSIQHVYRFNNVQGNIRIPGNANNTYVFDNCAVNLTWSITTPACTIVIRDSEVVLNSNLPNATLMIYSSTASLNSNYANVSVKDSTIAGLASSTRLNTPNFSAFSSIINQEVSSSNVVYKDSQINKDIYSVNNGTSIVGYIDNCIWNEIQQHISSDTPNTTYTGTWINNNATKANPIVIDRANLAASDGLHHYTYNNNTGSFLPKNYHNIWSEFGCFAFEGKQQFVGYYLNRPELFNHPVLITGDAYTMVWGSNKAHYCWGVFCPTNWQPSCPFFSIGTVMTKRIKLTIQVPFKGVEDPEGTTWSSPTDTEVHTYSYSKVISLTTTGGENYKLTEFNDALLTGPRIAPFSYTHPAEVNHDSSVVPPSGADMSYFMIEVEMTD